MDVEALPGNPLLIVGQQDGSVVLREFNEGLAVATTLHGQRNSGHVSDVRAVMPGPSDYFFTGGNDGKFCVWQCIVPGAPDGAAAVQA